MTPTNKAQEKGFLDSVPFLKDPIVVSNILVFAAWVSCYFFHFCVDTSAITSIDFSNPIMGIITLVTIIFKAAGKSDKPVTMKKLF